MPLYIYILTGKCSSFKVVGSAKGWTKQGCQRASCTLISVIVYVNMISPPSVCKKDRNNRRFWWTQNTFKAKQSARRTARLLHRNYDIDTDMDGLELTKTSKGQKNTAKDK